MIARRFVVKGKVQGVGFRYFAIRAGRRLGIVGAVRNRTDGSVEAITEGKAEAIADFRRQLERGPDTSQVVSVEETDLPVTGLYTKFDVAY